MEGNNIPSINNNTNKHTTMKNNTTAKALASKIGNFVRTLDKIGEVKAKLIAEVGEYLKANGCPKLLRKELNATKLVDRRRVSEVLMMFGIKSELAEVRSNAAKSKRPKVNLADIQLAEKAITMLKKEAKSKAKLIAIAKEILKIAKA
jgi:hypothetical protein